jgi:hypothetical protein
MVFFINHFAFLFNSIAEQVDLGGCWGHAFIK